MRFNPIISLFLKLAHLHSICLHHSSLLSEFGTSLMKEEWFKSAILKHIKDNPSSAMNTLFPKSMNYASSDYGKNDKLLEVTPQTRSFKKFTEHAPDGEASMDINSRSSARGGFSTIGSKTLSFSDHDCDLFPHDCQKADARSDCSSVSYFGSICGGSVHTEVSDSCDDSTWGGSVDMELSDSVHELSDHQDHLSVSKSLFPSKIHDQPASVPPQKKMNNFQLNISTADIFEFISAIARGEEGDDLSTSIVKKYVSASVSDRSSKCHQTFFYAHKLNQSHIEFCLQKYTMRQSDQWRMCYTAEVFKVYPK